MDLDTLGYFLYMDKMEKQQQAERERNPFDDDDSDDEDDESRLLCLSAWLSLKPTPGNSIRFPSSRSISAAAVPIAGNHPTG